MSERAALGHAWRMLTFIVVVCGSVSTASAQASPPPGQDLYIQNCFSCHGFQGVTGPVVDLTQQSTAQRSDTELIDIIAEGRPDKGMPSFGRSLKAHEIRALTLYLRVLQGRSTPQSAQAFSVAPVRDDADRLSRGLALFRGKARCDECHSVYDEGGVVGPDLDSIGATLNQAEVRDAIVRPSQAIAKGYRERVFVTSAGETIRGRARKETAETIQLLDETGELWTTYFKRDLESRELDVASSMPADLLDALSASEAEDLIHFLSTLR